VGSDAPIRVCFDLDGTLVDPKAGIRATLRATLDEVGVAMPADDCIHAMIGPPLADTFRVWFPHRDEAWIAACVGRFRAYYPTLGLPASPVYEGIFDLLASLSADGAWMAVVTHKPRVFARELVALHGMEKHFQEVWGPSMGQGEWSKVPVLRACGERVVMVGDRGSDMRAAREAGARALGVRWGYGTVDELMHDGAEAVAATPGELLRLLRGA